MSRNSPGNGVRGRRDNGYIDDTGTGWGIGYNWVSSELSADDDIMGIFQSVIDKLAVLCEVTFDGERKTGTIG